jgi:hypothetical protein
MKWLFKLVLTSMQFYPLLTLQPPLTVMEPAERYRFLKRRFYTEISLVPKRWRFLVKGMIRIAKQMAYLGYYNDPTDICLGGVCPLLPAAGHAGQVCPITTAATPASACVHSVGDHHRYLAR